MILWSKEGNAKSPGKMILLSSIFILSASLVYISATEESKRSVSSRDTPLLDIQLYDDESHLIFQYQQKFHQSGFGGIYNINHPAGARARRKLAESAVIIPESANSFATPSIAKENILNLHGHYVHDEHRSPFASFLYDRPKIELEEEQKDYEKRMKKIREEWGAWDFNDEHPEIRPIADFDKVPYRDLENSKFPRKAWQMDEKYVKDFISEGKKLVHRVREAIYAEYGHPTKDLKTKEEIEARDKLFEVRMDNLLRMYPAIYGFKFHFSDILYFSFSFQVIVMDDIPTYGMQGEKGWAAINKDGLEMYAKKLLHSMITNDEFYWVLGGHSAAAGHGNNFHQTYSMEFANIMEPVLHKLGVRLIARNLAMGGLGTTHFSHGANSLYGKCFKIFFTNRLLYIAFRITKYAH